jgi:hypothetical protein
MIRIKEIAPGVFLVTAPQILKTNDFADFAPRVDAIIRADGKIRLLIDASALEGWKDIAALETHSSFVKKHQQAVERIAVIVRHDWQHWLVGAVKVFLHPEVRVFEKDGAINAMEWITGERKDRLSVMSAAE